MNPRYSCRKSSTNAIHPDRVTRFNQQTGLMRLPYQIFWSKIRLHGLLLLDLVPPPPPPQHTRLAPQSWFPLGLLSPAKKDRFEHNYQRKIIFENLGRVLLNPWNGFHHDLLLLPGAASTRRGATFSFRAALLSPHQGGCSRDSKAEEVNLSIEIEV